MGKSGWLAAVLAMSMAACGSNTPSNTNNTADSGNPVADAGGDAGGAADVAVDAGRSTAGNPCTADSDCNNANLSCDMSLAAGECTGSCTESTSQVTERAACGGVGSTCLTSGDGAQATSNCWRSCSPTASSVAAGACPTAFVCTGFWYTHMGGTPDSPGCIPYCTMDAQCASGAHCNPRIFGQCLGSPAPTSTSTALADGEPCDPTRTQMVAGESSPRNVQCRGVCFQYDTNTHHGICGSSLNTKTASACPDDSSMSPLGTSGDNLAICLLKTCTTNSDCTSPLICEMQANGNTVCDYSTDGGTGIPADGGTDASVTDATTHTDAATPTDTATPTDAGTAADAYVDGATG